MDWRCALPNTSASGGDVTTCAEKHITEANLLHVFLVFVNLSKRHGKTRLPLGDGMKVPLRTGSTTFVFSPIQHITAFGAEKKKTSI
jgi:hypothetical protein